MFLRRILAINGTFIPIDIIILRHFVPVLLHSEWQQDQSCSVNNMNFYVLCPYL